MITNCLLILAVALGIVALVAGAVFLVGPEYDRHAWVRKVLDAFAGMTPAYYLPPAERPGANLPQSYLDQIPGGGNGL